MLGYVYADGRFGPMRWCTGGSHVIPPSAEGVVETADGLWCSYHPVPLSLRDRIRDSERGVPCAECAKLRRSRRGSICKDCRFINFLLFHHWRYVTGRLTDDDFGVPLTDEEVDRLAPHILP